MLSTVLSFINIATARIVLSELNEQTDSEYVIARLVDTRCSS